MSGSTIGIKTADGKYYPVLEEGSGKKKRLVVTTVKDNQSKVQIDLYRGIGPKLEDAKYVGSLVIENIPPAPKGEPEIELYIGIDDEGNLNATAHDLVTDEKQTLSLSIDSLSEGETYDVPDFDIDEDIDFEKLEREYESSVEGLSVEDSEFEESVSGEGAEIEEIVSEQESLEESTLTGEAYPIEDTDRRRRYIEKRKRNPLFMILFVLLGLVIVAVIAYFIFINLRGEEVPPLIGGNPTHKVLPVVSDNKKTEVIEESSPANSSTVVKKEESSKPKTGDKSKEVGGTDTAKRVTTEKKSQKGGMWYRIKRGDTLWDISATFYRNPWLYPVIARKNKIRNPDLIFAGTKIFIPER